MKYRFPARFAMVAVALLASRAGPALGAEVYVVRFQTDIVYSSPSECYRVGWRDHLVFRNETDQDLSVVALSASNGYSLTDPQPLVIPARRTRSVLITPRFSEGGSTNLWVPRTVTGLWVNRLEVPAGIRVESRAEIWGPAATPMLPCPPPEPGGVPASLVFGAVPLPVIRTITPAGIEQVHLGIDLGTEQFRTNVGIYNAGPTEAHAVLELRRSCDDVAVQRRFVTLPGDSVVQVTGIHDDPPLSALSCSSSDAAYFSRYLALVMDQPGFSFITSLADGSPPRIGIATSAAR